MRHVLIVAYYFPPLGLSGVQRIAGFVRHLPEYGWQPTVLTAKPRGYFAYDDSLWTSIQEAGICVVQTKSLDPTRLFRSGSTIQLPQESNRRLLSSISNWFFIPDNKLGWMPFAVRTGLRQAALRKFRVILSSAPPYSGHLIGAKLSKRLGIPLVTDFRDDWVGNPRHFYPTNVHRKLHVRLEGKTLLRSSAITTVNRPILESLQKRHPHIKGAVKVIPHGYDEQNYASVETEFPKDDQLKFVYTGVFYDVQTPEYFLRGLSRLLTQQPAMRTKVSVIFAGLVPQGFDELIDTLNLDKVVQYVGYLQHRGIADLQQEADILWMTLGSREGAYRITPGKLAEYMGTRKPILGLVPQGAAQQTLLRYGAAYIAEPENVDSIMKALCQIKDDWQSQKLPSPDESFVSMFNRKNLTKELSDVLNSVIDTK